MIRTLVALAAIAFPTPKPPELCLPDLTLESYLCPDNIHYVLTERKGCEKPVVVFEACNVQPAVEDLADPPDVDPEFDENGPGPQPGPEGAPTVDRP